ncbi:hypothetical protein KVT40_000358 [Elsinoe batatas]|uniref:Uncharacterized protein n=1 Tax=Elsinoe batatas TaxID=2601811 RepID=A0A8K0LAT0_9PEZI|nr:hypothetical protein KVT40_000358 [Elsinoe batatas]
MADSSDANLGLQHPYDINQRHDVFAVHTGINSDVPEGWFDPQWDYSPQSTDFKLSLPIALGISAVDGSIGVDASVTVHHEPSAPWHALDTNRNTLIDPCAGGVREGQSILMPAQTQVDDSTNMSGAQHGLSVNHPHDHVIDTTTQASTHDRWVNPPWIITPDQSQRISSFPASTMPGQPLMYHDITPLHQTPSILVNVPTTTQVPCATILSSSRPTAEAQVVSVDHAANPPFGMTGGQLSVNALATIADGDSMQPPRGIKRSVGNMYVNAEICRPSDGKRRAVCFVGQADSGIAKARRVQLQLQRDIEKCLDYWGYEFQAEEYLETSTRNATKLKYRHGPGKRAWNEVVRAYQRWLPNACTSIPDISWPELPPIHDELQAGTLGLCHDVWYAVSQSLKTLVTFPSKKFDLEYHGLIAGSKSREPVVLHKIRKSGTWDPSKMPRRTWKDLNNDRSLVDSGNDESSHLGGHHILLALYGHFVQALDVFDPMLAFTA